MLFLLFLVFTLFQFGAHGPLRSGIEFQGLDFLLQRLEDEGIILRSGLTPTDMMCIRGDFTLYDAKASRLAVAFLAKSTHHTPEEIPALVYELVEKKLYNPLRIYLIRLILLLS